MTAWGSGLRGSDRHGSLFLSVFGVRQLEGSQFQPKWEASNPEYFCPFYATGHTSAGGRSHRESVESGSGART